MSSKDSSGVPAVTKSHQFKFLGQKWRFLKHSYEDDYEHGLDTGKLRVLEEINSIEQRGVNERILSNIEKEVEFLLSYDECENSIAGGLGTQKSINVPQSNSSIASSTTYGGAGVELDSCSEDQMGLDSNSIVSHLTAYDAQDIQESIKNIKLYYSRQAMDRIDRFVEGRPKLFVKKEHENINGCFAPEGGNAHVSHRPRSKRTTSNYNHNTKPKTKKTNNTTVSTDISISPRRRGEVKSAPGNEETNRLQVLTNQVNSLNVGKLFKKHSLENSYRVPKCVANAPDK